MLARPLSKEKIDFKKIETEDEIPPMPPDPPEQTFNEKIGIAMREWMAILEEMMKMPEQDKELWRNCKGTRILGKLIGQAYWSGRWSRDPRPKIAQVSTILSRTSMDERHEMSLTVTKWFSLFNLDRMTKEEWDRMGAALKDLG
jgi:hypothetical protein